MQDIKNRLLAFILSITAGAFLLIYSKKPIGALIFMLALALVICIALWEYYSFSEKLEVSPQYTLGLLGAFCYVVTSFLALKYGGWSKIPVLVLGTTLFLLFFQQMIRATHPLKSVAVSLFGLLYIAVSLTTLMKINFFFTPQAPVSGQWWLMYLLVVTKSTDTGAYFIGKFFGRHKLAPKVSPNKTIEGLVAGILTALAASYLLIYLTPHVLVEMKRPGLFALIMGLTLPLFGQFSDLAESLLKRDAGVKDSSHIKGLGGVLDMVDSVIFPAPIFYLFLQYGSLV